MKKFSLIFIVILLDQLTKYWVIKQLIYDVPLRVNAFFNLNYQINQGAAFSLLTDYPAMAFWLFSSIAFTISFALLIWLYKTPTHKRLLMIGLNLIIGGAIGNLIDRIRLGHVIDFIQLHYGTYYWPVFNIADSAICLGAALLILDTLISQESRHENSAR